MGLFALPMPWLARRPGRNRLRLLVLALPSGTLTAGFIKARIAPHAALLMGIYVTAASASLAEGGRDVTGSFFMPCRGLVGVPRLMLAGTPLLLPAAPKAETMADASPQ